MCWLHKNVMLYFSYPTFQHHTPEEVHMKRFLTLLLTLLAACILCSCQSSADDSGNHTSAEDNVSQTQEDSGESMHDPFLALITDAAGIDDHSFNQSCWEAVADFAERNEIKYNYYRPAEADTASRIESIKQAITDGVTICVCPGVLFEEAIHTVQYEFPDIQFLLLDGEPRDADYNYNTAPNVHCILYKEEEAGYMAGYAAVMDGMTELGFIGGMALDAVIRYGYGFVQGADAAAEALDTGITIQYWYADTFSADDAVYQIARDWYTAGTEVIFACGGSLGTSVMKAAQELDTFVIGVDRDQHTLSESVITSASKQLYTTCTEALEQLRQNKWKWPESSAGKTAVLGAAENAVALPTSDAAWRFHSFTTEDYQALLAAIASGEMIVSDDRSQIPSVGTQTTVNYLS